jgi:hypothetical protein
MPAVIFFACLDLEEKSSVMDGHKLIAYYPENGKIFPYFFVIFPTISDGF